MILLLCNLRGFSRSRQLRSESSLRFILVMCISIALRPGAVGADARGRGRGRGRGRLHELLVRVSLVAAGAEAGAGLRGRVPRVGVRLVGGARALGAHVGAARGRPRVPLPRRAARQPLRPARDHPLLQRDRREARRPRAALHRAPHARPSALHARYRYTRQYRRGRRPE